jgi:methenyltetrahydrofolate cyclohydrolase
MLSARFKAAAPFKVRAVKDKEFVAKLQSEADELERLACAKEKELLDEINQELKV